MAVVSCTGCGRRLDAAIAVCPDCKTVLHEGADVVTQIGLTKAQVQRQTRAEAAEAKFRANAEAAAREKAAAEKQPEPTLGERYTQSRAQRQSEKETDAGVQRVAVVDIDMPFGSMVNFMVKWALASIPAIMILALFAAFAVAMLSLLR